MLYNLTFNSNLNEKSSEWRTFFAYC